MKPPRRRITIPLDGFSPPTIQWYKAGYHVEVDGRKIFVYERGTGPTLLFLHGFPTSCYDWRAVMQRLALNGRRVAFDFLGFGLSDKPEAYSYSLFEQADLVEALAAELKIDAAHVISHDMGTSVHCELLARQNEGRLSFRIKSSSLLNGSMLQWLAQITPFQQMLANNERLDDAIDLCRGDFESAYVPALRSLMRRPEMLTEEDAAVMNDLMRYQNGAHRIPAIGGYMRERYVHRDRWIGALEKTDTPLQFIWADGDPIATTAIGRELARRVSHARYAELEGIGHFLLFEAPEAVAAEIQKILCPDTCPAGTTAEEQTGATAAEAAEQQLSSEASDTAHPSPADNQPAEAAASEPAAAESSNDVGIEDPSASEAVMPPSSMVVDVSPTADPLPPEPAPPNPADHAAPTQPNNPLNSLIRRPVSETSGPADERIAASTESSQTLDPTAE